MDTFIKDLWNKNKILFFILIPLVIIVFFKDLLLDLLVGSARKINKEAKEKDIDLEKEIDKFNDSAEAHKNEAAKLKEAEDKVEDDKDWHKKR